MATTGPSAEGMLGRYQVLKPLAKGGMGEVLLARAIGLAGFARHVVIKRIRVVHGTEQKTIDMFLDEARLVAALHHRNIVQVLDVGEEDQKYFFVMEYVHGRDTRELLRHVKDKKQHIPLEHVLTIIAAAAAGLHHAHEQRGADRKPLGIVHRDISPGNILIGFDGGVKVVDFGIAKATLRSAATDAGEMKGKLGYMSPEQCQALPVDRRTDVFLLGIVMWELVTVRRLFRGETRFETMALIVKGDVQPPSKIRTDLPPEIEAVIRKALAASPDDRYQTADEVRVALESYATHAGIPLSPGRLSDYLKEQFGEVPEPWLVDDPRAPAAPDEAARRTSQMAAAGDDARESAATLPYARDSDRAIELVAPEPSESERQVLRAGPELEALRAAKPVVDGEPSKDNDEAPSSRADAPRPVLPPRSEMPRARGDAQPAYPVDPSSERRRRMWLVALVVLIVATGAFLLIALWP